MPDVRRLMKLPVGGGPAAQMPKTREYEAYLKGPVWARLREQRLEIDRCKCRTCGAWERLEVHHVRYPQVLGQENVGLDLITLCRDCHIAVHDSINERNA